MKKALSALVMVILVLGSFSISLATQVKAQTLQASVHGTNWFIAQDNSVVQYVDDLIAIGEVQNTGTATIGKVYVAGAAFNSTNSLIGSAEGTSIGNGLLPGQKAPFIIEFSPDATSFSSDQSIVDQDSYNAWANQVINGGNVTVSVVTATNSTVTLYPNVSVVNYQGSNSSGVYTVLGSAQNTGSQAANVFVTVTFYNGSGTVIGLNSTIFSGQLSSPILSGGSAPFSLTPVTDTGSISSQIATYSVLVEATPYIATVTPTPTINPTISPSGSPTIKPSQGPGLLSSTTIYIIVIVAAIIVVVLAVIVFLRKRGGQPSYDLPPPPPPPPPS